MANKEQISLSWDWKEQPDFKKLKEIGIFVYEDPRYEGSDQIAYIFSRKELTPEEIEKFAKED